MYISLKKILLLVISLLLVFSSSYPAKYFQMEWNSTIVKNETWTTINLTVDFVDPVVVAEPEYSVTTHDNGIMVWVRNVTNKSFQVRTSDENFSCADNIRVHYIVMERGSWILPNSTIKVEAGKLETNKAGHSGSSTYWECPTYGESVLFQKPFSSYPLVMSTRGSDNNPNTWGLTFQHDLSTYYLPVSTTGMCIGLSQSRAISPGTFTKNETIYWIAADQGYGTIGGSEFEIRWVRDDTGVSGGLWINGYYDGRPFLQYWTHTWVGAPNIIVAGETTVAGTDGGWGVIYDTGNTTYIRMFTDEANERIHPGSESGGGWAFDHSSYVYHPPEIYWAKPFLDLGYGTINETTPINSTRLYSYKTNTNITITCISGNCSIISASWNQTTLTNDNYEIINFSCSNKIKGNFSAIFRANSSEDPEGDLINVSCIIYPVYGSLKVTLIQPPINKTTLVAQNQTFTVKASIICIGDTNTTCGNVTAYVRHNSTTLFGNGKDGDLIITNSGTIINNYTSLITQANISQTVIQVANSNYFSIGDEILIIQLQNGSGVGKAGNYEFNIVKNISGNNLTLETPLSHTYGAGPYNTIGATATQIVRVPNYRRLTITSTGSIIAPPWNGSTGGIVVLKALEYINMSGYINVSQRGFRGGSCNGCGNNDWGQQGEGYLGLGTNSLTNNGNGGGGGYGPTGYEGEPGGGGGYGTAGGDGIGSFTTEGGKEVGNAPLTKLYFGGGAGGGGDNDLYTPYPQYVDGAGIAIVFAKEIINAKIEANGEDAIKSTNIYGGVTGGGAGGTIWLSGINITISNVTAKGGSSVYDGDDLGGAGGDGRIRLDYITVSGTTNPSPGYNGTIKTIMKQIPTYASSPLWTPLSQPQVCGILKVNQSCNVTWSVNATGPINSTHLIDVIFYSDKLPIKRNNTKNTTIKIVDDIIPVVTLLLPTNNIKLLTNGTVKFVWNIVDDSPNVSCYFYLNSILNRTMNCNTSVNSSLILTLKRGKYNWTVKAVDAINNTAVPTPFNLTVILNYFIKVSKEIQSISTNIYFISTKLLNLISATRNIMLLEFVTNKTVAGSFSPTFTFVNITNGPTYIGKIYAWNLSINPNSTYEVNYSIAGINNYHIGENYIIGIS